MFKPLFAFAFVLQTLCLAYYYPKNDDALGLFAGTAQGLTYKTFLDKSNAASISYAQSGSEKTLFISTIHHSYIFSPAWLSLYFGAGGFLGRDDKFKAGLHFPLGIDFLPRSIPFDFFIELAPLAVIAPNVQIKTGAFAGFRFWF
ncbi:MAG: hypothetical protein ACTTIC_05315 [Helicobacteraceae bacterium]